MNWGWVRSKTGCSALGGSRLGLPSALRDVGVGEESLPRLAEEAATQWPGKFNPRSFDTRRRFRNVSIGFDHFAVCKPLRRATVDWKHEVCGAL